MDCRRNNNGLWTPRFGTGKETQKPKSKTSLVTQALNKVQMILKAAATDASTQLIVQGAILGIEKVLGR